MEPMKKSMAPGPVAARGRDRRKEPRRAPGGARGCRTRRPHRSGVTDRLRRSWGVRDDRTSVLFMTVYAYGNSIGRCGREGVGVERKLWRTARTPASDEASTEFPLAFPGRASETRDALAIVAASRRARTHAMSRAAKSAVFAGRSPKPRCVTRRAAHPTPPPTLARGTHPRIPAPPSSLTPRPRVPRPRLPQESSDDDAWLDDVPDDAPSPSETPASPAEASRATPEEGEGPSASHPPPARATPTPPNDDDDAPAPTKNVAAPDDVAPEADAVAPDDHNKPRPAHPRACGRPDDAASA